MRSINKKCPPACLRTGAGSGGCAFGDIFLEDLERWREENLARVGLRGIFPIWRIDSRELILEFFELGFGTAICCVNDAYLDETQWAGTSTRNLLRRCPRTWIPAAKMGSFIPSPLRGRCLNER